MIDLKLLSHRKYKVRLDESYEAEQGGKEWYFQIPSRKKHHIYVHGENLLGVFIFGKHTRKKIQAIPGIKPHQIGDNEATFLFQPELLDQVAEAIGARKSRPQLSEEHKAALSASNSAFRFQKSRFPE